MIKNLKCRFSLVQTNQYILYAEYYLNTVIFVIICWAKVTPWVGATLAKKTDMFHFVCEFEVEGAVTDA